jgi:Uma2 family endonuclease
VTVPWPDHLLSLTEWDALPHDPTRRYELIEGVLLVTPRPAVFHQRAMVHLTTALNLQLPPDLCAVADVEVVVESLGPATVRVPDVIVIPTSLGDTNPPRVDASDVLLAVEIISPGSMRTDRVMKLSEYADAGIAAYWLLDVAEPVTLSGYTLVDGDYEITAEGSGVLELRTPAPVRIDLNELISR